MRAIKHHALTIALLGSVAASPYMVRAQDASTPVEAPAERPAASEPEELPTRKPEDAVPPDTERPADDKQPRAKNALSIDSDNENAGSKLAAAARQSPKEGLVRRESYGEELVVTYIFAPVVAVGLSAATESLAGTVFFLAPPVVHFANENLVGGLLALVGMSGSTALFGYVGYTVAYDVSKSCDGRGLCFSGLEGAIYGGVLGYIAWGIIDSAFLAYREVSVEQAAERRQPRILAGVTPVRGGAMGSVVGRF